MSRIFITGGKAAGKTEYAKTYEEKGCHVIDDICILVRTCVEEAGWDDDIETLTAKVTDRLDAMCGGFEDVVTVGTEMGCGVVPIERKERLLREVNGRVNCMLAKHADRVILMQTGIPVVIKDTAKEDLK